jgi:hypothetical protein
MSNDKNSRVLFKAFGFRILNLFRISYFGFRIYKLKGYFKDAFHPLAVTPKKFS